MRIVEVYASTQGEGPNVGRTTVFTRFGGCNLRCPGWPCDTQFAIDPKFRDEWTKLTPDALGIRIGEVARNAGARTITLTGGEPFLQPDEELLRLVHELRTAGFDIDCFSNGTRPYPQWAVENIQFIVDWKLPGSGEVFFGPTNIQRGENLAALLHSPLKQSVKFVIKDRADYELARQLYWTNKHVLNHFNVYYGAVWGEIETAQLVEWVMQDKLDWLLNVQVHNYIWDPTERGR